MSYRSAKDDVEQDMCQWVIWGDM